MSNPFNYLSEKPERKNLLFGHKKILEALVDIVGNCPAPFTIGLFGRWGSGKSSIAESLQSAVKVKEIPVVLFDVWKHEGDALRRTFLKEIHKQLRTYGNKFFDMDFKLSPRIEGDVQKKLEDDFSWKRISNIVLNYLVLPLLVCVLFYFRLREIWPSAADIVKSWGSEVVTLAVLLAILQFVYSYFKDLAIASDVLITQNRLTDPHDFEEEFNRILNATQYERIAIVFDNLDRVSGESALAIISTIKTFLEPVDVNNERKKVIFILPCDVNAIKTHISAVMQSQVAANFNSSKPTVQTHQNSQNEAYDYADEFLRKFFNTIIWIPEFYEVELEKYASEKLKETKIKEFDNTDLAWLIIQVFSQNPRQIIQFINVLISNYLVMREISQDNGFGNTLFHQNNVPQLAKFVLLVQRFPQVMEAYRVSKTYDLMSPSPVPVETLHGWNEFNRFRENTAGIKIASLEPFFTFKISDYERQLPGVTKLFDAMDNNEVSIAIVEAENLKIGNHLEEFSGAVRNYLKHKSNSVIITNFLNTLFAITETKKITLTSNTYLGLQKGLRESGLTHVERIIPRLLVNEFINKDTGIIVTEFIKEKVVTRWVDVLRNQHGEAKTISLTEDMEIDIVRQLQVLHDYIKFDLQELLRGTLTAKAGNLLLAEALVDSNVQEKFLGTSFVEASLIELIAALTKYDNVAKRIAIITKVDKSILKSVPFQSVLEKLSQFLNHANVAINLEEKIMIVEQSLILLDCFAEQMRNDTDSAAATGFVNMITTTHNNIAPARYVFLPFAAVLSEFGNQYYPRLIDRIYMDFSSNLNSTNPNAITETLKKMPNAESFVGQYKDTIRPNVRNSPDQFLAIYEFAPEAVRLEMLSQWVNEVRFEWLTTYQDKFIATGLPDLKSIFDAIVNRLRDHNNPDHWKFALAFLNKLGLKAEDIEKQSQEVTESIFIPDEASINNLMEVLVAKLQFEDQNIAEMALNWVRNLRCLSNSDKAVIAGKLVPWLATIGHTFRPNVYEAIAEGFSNLDPKVKLEYVNYLLGVLILQSGNTTYIAEAVKYVRRLDISISDFLPKLESIHSNGLAARGNNPTQAKSLIDALFSLTERHTDKRVKELHQSAVETISQM